MSRVTGSDRIPAYLLDENVPLRLRPVFESLGLDAHHLSDEERGLSDEEVLDRALREDRVLVTSDLGFGRLYYLRFRGEVGIVVLRIRPPTFENILGRVRSFLQEADLEDLARSLVLLESHRYRVLR